MPMNFQTHTLTFLDLAALYVIIEFKDSVGLGPQISEMKSAVNVWIKDNKIDARYCAPISSLSSQRAVAERLKLHGLLDNSIQQGKKLTPTKAGYQLMQKLGPDWRKWPIRLPIRQGRASYEDAIYAYVR